VVLAFDSGTNLAGRTFNVRASCTDLLALNDDDTYHGIDSCAFTDAQTLVVYLTSDATLPFTGTVVTLKPVIFSQFMHSTAVTGALTVVASSPAPVPVVQVTGPSVVGGACSSTGARVLRATVTNTGGRPVVLAWSDSLGNTLVAATWTLNASAPAGTVTYVVNATNWMGQWSASAPFAVVYSSGVALSVQLTAPAQLSLDASTLVDVSATVSLPLGCSGIASPVFTYQWSLVNQYTSADITVSALGATRARARATSSSPLPPGASYSLTLTVTASGVDSNSQQPVALSGVATTTLLVQAAPMAVILLADSSTQEGRAAVFDASASCDPNLPTPKCTALGVLDAADRNTSTISVTWLCLTTYLDSCTSEDVSCVDDGCFTSGTVAVLYADKLSAARAPYQFQAIVSSVSGSGAATSFSYVANVIVIAAPPRCVLPVVATAPFPARINAQSDDGIAVSIQGSINATADVQLHWTSPSLDVLAEVLVPGTTDSSLNLLVLTSRLAAGNSYTFQLAASVACSPATATLAQVTFQVNSGPLGGLLDVEPLSGSVGLTQFSLSASLFEDPEGDLPISIAFEAEYQDGIFSPLSDFSLATTLQVVLQRAVDGLNVTVVALARDSLGAQSARTATASVDVYAIVVAANAFDASTVLAGVTDSGGSSDDKLATISALAQAAVSSSNNGSADALQWQQGVQTALLNALSDDATTATDAGATATTPRSAALKISTLYAVVKSAETTNQSADFLSQAGDLTYKLLQLAQTSVDAQVLGSQDPQASSQLPSSLPYDTLSALDSTMQQLQNAQGSDTNGRRRLLLNAQDPASVRASLAVLVDLIMTGAVVGTPQLDLVGGGALQLSVLRTTVGDAGAQAMELPAFDPDVAPTRFVFPAGVLNDAAEAAGDVGLDDLITVVAARFRVNVDELVTPGALVVASGDVANLSYSPNVTEFVALEFQLNGTRWLHPSDLAMPIEITNPFSMDAPPGNQTTAFNATANITLMHELQCGYWDLNALGWSSQGCFVANVTYGVNGSITCACNHASDYAAWQAFTDEISGVFTTQVELTAVTTISLVLVCVLLPSLVGAWAALTWWGRRRDLKDADAIHLGIFVLLTANKIKLHQKQRRLFQALRQYQKTDQPVSKDEYEAPRLHRRLRSCTLFCKALYYESSLLGLATRFDPYYERMQRVSILLGVLVGNLFIASFFYQLQVASDVSIGFLIGRIVLGSLVVIIPVKLVVRVLFIVTVAKEGSTMDRAVHIFRVLALQKDAVPVAGSDAERADLALMDALKRFYVAKRRTVRLTAQPSGTDGDKGGGNDVDDVESAKQAEQRVMQARVELAGAIRKSQDAWRSVPRTSLRTMRVQRERSTLFKLAAVLAEPEEPGPRPIERGSCRVSHPFVYFTWVFLFVYFVGCFFYMAFWVVTRPDAVQSQMSNDSTPADVSAATDAILEVWLTSAGFAVLFTFVVTEPLLIMVRFVLLPACLRRVNRRARNAQDGDPENGAQVSNDLTSFRNLKAPTAHKPACYERVTQAAFGFASEVINTIVP